MNARPSSPTIFPETAPFSPEQRAWLNGFFSGFVSVDSGITALSSAESASIMAGAPDADDGEAPWHDQTLSLTERMQLAEGRPLRRRMMAAMAQQDCGQCGYNCNDYSDAIASKQEARLNLCVPGGKETARMLKKLYEEIGSAPPGAGANIPAVAEKVERAAKDPGQSRDNPALATFHSRALLNKQGSAKETWHVELDLSECGLEYAVGDSLGLFPANDEALVEAIIAILGADPSRKIGECTLREILLRDVSLSPAPDSLFQLLSYLTGGERRAKAKALAAGEDPDGDAATLDVLATLEKFWGVRPDPEAFIEALEPLQPRLYSISSSQKSNPGRVSLTIDAVRYRINNRERLGVASTYIANRIQPGDRLRVYVQKAHNFGLPSDPATPIVMIGPGTGVAPFRAFLQERMAIKAPGKNWLFFGHQKQACDFFYEDELMGMKAAGVLTRLSLAWSREASEKIYVQDRMRENGQELWAWLAQGAHFYVCGDAKRMAKDVEGALIGIAAEFGARTTEEAIAFVADLKKSGRYQADVY
ncbi:MAG TPA: sulfite reductase subunit alpha [Xanthobacteraceae bacterium]|nr:sulfite reductase subunit alpha [Xanthobacteraceae bacterium]